MKRIFCCLLALSIWQSFSYSQPDTSIMSLSLNELLNKKINVSSTIPVKIMNSPSNVTIIDKETIQDYNFLTLSELLKTVAGVDVLQSNLDQNIPTFRGVLQNYYANKILIMINNVPVWQPIYGNTTLERVNINDIERIEILKGPASVLYGSNAYMGVINIILQNPVSTKGNCNLKAGFPGITGAGGNVSFRKKNLSFFISAHSDYEKQKPVQILSNNSASYRTDKLDTFYYYNQNYMSTSFNTNIAYKSHNLLINYFNYDHAFLGVNNSFLSGSGTIMKNEGILTAYRFEKELTEKFFAQINASYDYFHRNYPDNYDRATYLDLAGDRLNANAKLNFNITDLLSIETGIEAENRTSHDHKRIFVLTDSIIRQNMKDDKPIFEWSVFSQINYKTKNINLLGGIRYTNNNVVGTNISGRLSGVLVLNKSNAIKILMGQAFRTPTMLELYFDHPTVVGNKQLKPEENNTFEIAYLAGFKNIYLQSTIYYSQYKNLIQRITTVTPSIYKNNIDFEGYGTEIEIKYNVKQNINSFCSYSYTKGLSEKAVDNYKLVPEHSVSFGLHYHLNNFSIAGNGYYTSEVEGLLGKIKPQTYFDLHIGFWHKPKKETTLTHTISFKNVTNSKSQIPQYVRASNNLNVQEVTANGLRIIYTLDINF